MTRSLLLAALTLPILSLRALLAQAPDVPAEVPPQIQILQPGVKLTLLAEHPDLVTPTGIDVDEKGNIWLASSHTHHRPKDYVGPEKDEILVFDKHGKNRRVFYNKTDATMHVKIGPDGWVYLAERSRILRVKDTDGDGVGDLEENIAALDTVSTYPHNGLSGMAWHPDGGLVFALGENFGKDWTLTSKDGVKVSGRGEGGVFWCRPDGTGMRRIARGFWNPFGLFVREDGEIFAVDNDPGSRPPCRLLNIVEGADYGFQWVYGSAPVHPFVAWNGELRGTLGMVHPSGEAPCALVPLGGGVLVPSWSNHCIDYFPLVRKGAGYTSERVELLRGSDFFRPACISQGPDGAFYMTDWVFSSYELHGRGRLWKLEIDQAQATWAKPAWDPMNEAAQLAKELREGRTKLPLAQLFEIAKDKDAYLSDAALTAIARESMAWTPESLRAMPTQDRLWALVALRRVDLNDPKWVRALIKDNDPEIRFECLRWIADAVLTEFSGDVERMLTQPDLDFRAFEAVLATWNTLRGKPEAGVTNAEVLAERVTDPATPARLKGFALRLLPDAHPKITVAMLRELLAVNDPVLSLEVVRTLAGRNADDARAILAEIVADENRSAELRAEAVCGLATSAASEHQALLLKAGSSDVTSVRNEALRALRFSTLDADAKAALGKAAERYPESAALVKALLDPGSINAGRPAFGDTEAWLARLASLPGKPDAETGRRIFFHSRLGLCASCHRHSGRGNVVGPDLSLIAHQGNRASLLRSILEPNRDVAPQFYPTLLKLKDGTDFTGIMLRSWSKDVFRDLTGKERLFEKTDIVERTELKTSLMPPGLVASLTDGELRDLLEFLQVGAPATHVAAMPDFEWVAAGGGAKSDKTRAVTFDREGNTYLVGETTDDGTFGGVKRQSLGGSDFFLAKVAPQGSFLWVRGLGGSLVDRGYGVALDSAGNVYVTGHYQSTDAQALGQTLPNAGDYDIFVAKYNQDGAPQWIRTAGGSGYDYGHAIAVDSRGHIVVTGAVAGEAHFGDITVNAGSTTRPIFCAKYDAQGQLLWVKTTSGRFSGSGHGVGVDANDSIYIGGSGSGVGEIGTVPLEGSRGQSAVMLKLTAEGDAVWATMVPGKPSAGFHEITVDAKGRVWGAGMFKGEVTIGDKSATTTGVKDSDGLFVHFSSDGKLQWSHVIQGPGTDYCLGVATDGTGRAFVTGEFSATATFAGQALNTQGSTDIYTAAFNNKGALEWLVPNGGAKGDNAYTMAWHPSGRLIIAGSCTAPVTFGTHTMSSPGSAEAYAAMMRVP